MWKDQWPLAIITKGQVKREWRVAAAWIPQERLAMLVPTCFLNKWAKYVWCHKMVLNMFKMKRLLRLLHEVEAVVHVLHQLASLVWSRRDCARVQVVPRLHSGIWVCRDYRRLESLQGSKWFSRCPSSHKLKLIGDCRPVGYTRARKQFRGRCRTAVESTYKSPPKWTSTSSQI